MFAHKNYGRAGYVDDPSPNILYNIILCLFGSLLALYGSTSVQLNCVVAFGPFFLLSVVPLKKKRKRDSRLRVIMLHHLTFELVAFIVYAYYTGQYYHAS